MAKHLHALVHSTILYLPAQCTPPLVQFVTAVWWTYVLDPSTFGFVNFVISLQEMFALFGLSGWTLFVLRFRERFRAGEEARFVAMDQRVTAVSCLLQLTLAPIVLIILGLPCDAATIAAVAFYLVTKMLVTHYGDWVRADHAIPAYTVAQLVASLAGFALWIGAIRAFGPNAATVLGALALGQALALAALIVMKGIRFGPGAFDKSLFGDFRLFAAPVLLGGVIGWGSGNAIRVLVQYMDGPEALGFISVGWTLGQRIASVLAMLLTAAAFPLAVRHYEAGDRRGALEQISFNGVLLLGILLPACVGLAMIVEPVVTVLIAQKFRDTTIVVFPIALLAAGLRYMRIHTCEQTMLLIERPGLANWVVGAEAIANILFCALGLRWAGFGGAAFGMLCGTALVTAASYIYCFTTLGLPVPALRDVLKIGLACGVMALVLSLAPVAPDPVAVSFAVLAGVVVYAAAIVLLFPQIRMAVAAYVAPSSYEAPL